MDSELRNTHERSLIALMRSSTSSTSSSSTSSYSSWTPDEDAILPLSSPPARTGSEALPQELDRPKVAENGAIRGMGLGFRLVSFSGHSGLEWKDIERRFDQIASRTGNGPEAVVKWSGFGFCIGMQQSLEFANELLRALRGGRDWKVDITKSDMRRFWFRMKDDSFDSRMRIFFDMCDRNMDGRITEPDIKQTILLSAFTNKLSVTQEEAEDYAAMIMDLLDSKSRGYIEVSQMGSLFKTRPPNSSSLSSSPTTQLPVVTNNGVQNGEFPEEQELMSRGEVLFRTYWRRAWIILLWVIACFVLFYWKFVQYRDRSAFQVMGYCLSTAKGAAETLKLNMALILLPVCRNTITWLRKHPCINSAVPFNDNINFHKLIAGGIVVGVILHGGTHLACDFPRISGADKTLFKQTIAMRFGYHQPNYLEILTTIEVASGIAMVILMVIAFVLATKWPRRRSAKLPLSLRKVTGYNTFWYSHHLFILVYGLLIIHSMFLFLTDKWLEKTTWMYVAFPVLLYIGERIFRAIRSGFYEVDILKANPYPGKVLYLKMQKPEGFEYQSGMYIFLQCPQISSLEWHPFSLTSGPQDDYLSVHIRTLGDWSNQIYAHFQEAVLSRGHSCPTLYIDGPYGAAAQDYVKYDIVVLIGLGIGATPFISILKDILNGVQAPPSDHRGLRERSLGKKPLKAYFYWTTREQSSFDWFRDSMKEISNSNKKKVVEMHNFLTNVYREGDVRSALISIIQALHHSKNGIDVVSNTPIRTHFARPNWFNIFSRLALKHRGARIGVFYCGPSNLARDLKGLCTKFSTKTTTRFVFHKENY
ncbi:respiratory burst oxidase homolog protein A-like isoform X1 [Neltuma alba]|uniref:respiratory burst oxidase homolog protein A-like isoform X1 n=2 Tax=Neltuma alba TaxID=207710 RepID=UPI0010A37F55|nr:respiratory burst oxidase homolog protein A-like isoform X1 [Prosopis alba]